jgi:hypothetical protein
MIYVIGRIAVAFAIRIIKNDATLSENESATIECKTCGKIVPVSKLEQHVMKEHFW